MRSGRVIGSVVVLLAGALIASACGSTPPADELGPTIMLGDQRLDALIADDDEERFRGLQGYDPLGDDTAMVFVWDEPYIRTFAMKEVSFPIEVIFIDDSLTVSAIHSLQPGDTTPVQGPSPSGYVVEVRDGWTDDHGVDVGSPFVPPGDAD